ncbi:MAG: hypothetical protein RIR11_2515 [Bacteroidota bacterium]|jgi:hypothetical protein
MKKILFLLLSFWFWSGCDKTKAVIPDDQNVPDTVVQAISGKFGTATDLIVTTLQNNALYAADFTAQMVRYKAIIRQNGSFQNLDAEAPLTDMPANARVYLDNRYPGAITNHVYKHLDPATLAITGYLTYITTATERYLVDFDPLGIRISSQKVPQSNWWRFTVSDINNVPANIRSVVQSARPSSAFRYAVGFTDVNQVATWQVAVSDSNFVHIYDLDASAKVLDSYIEDLLDIDNQQLNNFDLLLAIALPTEVTNFLNSQFPGWIYERGFAQANSADIAVGFLVIITFDQNRYYTRFDTNGIFKGAIKE